MGLIKKSNLKLWTPPPPPNVAKFLENLPATPMVHIGKPRVWGWQFRPEPYKPKKKK